MMWQNLEMLRQTVLAHWDLSYAQLRGLVEPISRTLMAFGCPMQDWMPRVMLLLKYVNKREFVEHGLKGQLTALALQLQERHTTLRASTEFFSEHGTSLRELLNEPPSCGNGFMISMLNWLKLKKTWPAQRN